VNQSSSSIWSRSAGSIAKPVTPVKFDAASAYPWSSSQPSVASAVDSIT
jgi:hypothetical protein